MEVPDPDPSVGAGVARAPGRRTSRRRAAPARPGRATRTRRRLARRCWAAAVRGPTVRGLPAVRGRTGGGAGCVLAAVATRVWCAMAAPAGASRAGRVPRSGRRGLAAQEPGRERGDGRRRRRGRGGGRPPAPADADGRRADSRARRSRLRRRRSASCRPSCSRARRSSTWRAVGPAGGVLGQHPLQQGRAVRVDADEVRLARGDAHQDGHGCALAERGPPGRGVGEQRAEGEDVARRAGRLQGRLLRGEPRRGCP